MPTCEARSAGKGRTQLVLSTNPISVHPSNVSYIYTHVLVQFKHTRSNIEKDIIHSPQAPSFHPIGTNAAATCCNPLSVANKLNCAAAFLVS
jgi:hypothetical protein